MNIKITNSGFSTVGMFGQNHRLIEIDGTPLFYTCTAFSPNDHRIFVLKSDRQLCHFVPRGVVVDEEFVFNNIDKLMEESESHNNVYIYCVTTTGMIVRPVKESFSWGAPSYKGGYSSDVFDMESDLFSNIMKHIIEDDNINHFYFVDAITGKEIN
uniref:Uncharacterized protein n=1 Tax=Aeromonas phage vB_AdhaM_G2 TaxID=3238786 RepID=A0AB39TZW3_9CAUD